MAEVVIGTSGYSYKDWIGPFYPDGTKESEFLEYYAKAFNYVELNFSYYAMPTSRLTQNMAARTSDGFLFGIKAHKSLTHEIDPAQLDACADQFRKGIEPLAGCGKLGAVLFQFPFSFHYTDENRRYMDRLLSSFDGYPNAVEFRNSEWLRDSVYEGLAARSIALVNVDEPELPKLIKASDKVTAQLAYLRFHGRNKKDWWTGTNVTRYDYLYSESELDEWLPRIAKMIEAARILIVAFNNHYKAQAVKNAIGLKNTLSAKGIGEIR
jgi:uncharacterized protein YecE (DUF72 family)